MKTYLPKENEIQRQWHLVDAEDKVLGRLAVRLAEILRGRHKPTWTPHLDTGDFVIVVNADKVALTGRKEERKIYQHYTGHMSGRREMTAAQVRIKQPTRMIMDAVRGMLPKGRLGRLMIRKLKVYAGPEHPHQSQQPVNLDV